MSLELGTHSAPLRAVSGETARVLVDGYAMGSLSMTSYPLGM